MKLATRILLAIFIIIGAAFTYLTQDILTKVRLRYLEGVEETLVDQSQHLAAFVSHDMEKKTFSPKELHKIFDNTYHRRFVSKIYQITKTRVDIRVTITDHRGLILFDSTRRVPPGTDFSQWRDVHLTLKGKYGARSSRDNPNAQNSSVLYVAAPLMVNGEIAGVLTLAKPTTNINHFLALAKTRIKIQSMVVTGLVIFLSVLILWILTKPIKLLTKYANDISAGRKAVLPNLDKSEIGDMGRAFENMREALENKKYVEKYVQTLTHEIKSPVSAIKGAAELLGEHMPRDQRERFLDNICTESDRIKMLVDRMLELASIENMTALKGVETILIIDLVKKVILPVTPLLEQKKLRLVTDMDETIQTMADPFLIQQAILNLIQNSADFSMPGDRILISLNRLNRSLVFKVQDQGPGIPEYAENKIFDRFYSLQRPATGKKSTGLGLNFVKEIALLHRGTVHIKNRSQAGACATLTLPAI